MNPETARILAQALTQRDVAAEGLKLILKTSSAQLESVMPIDQTLVGLAETYIHEQRIINRIIFEAEDE